MIIYYLLSASYLLIIIIIASIKFEKNLSILIKIYTNEAKYNDHNNYFKFKLAKFHNICLKTNILNETKIKKFLTMLKHLDLDYYYFNISTSAIALNFNQVCNSDRNYFEKVKSK